MKIKKILLSNYITNIIAILALVLSIISFVYICQESRKKEKEILDISSQKVFFDQPVSFYSGLPELIITSFWECILTNNGEKTLSLINYDVKALKDGKHMIFYSNLNQGLYDEELRQIELPINIEPGNSKKIYTKIGIMIHEKADSLLMKLIDNKKSYTFRDLKILLAKHGLDIFDNDVEALIENNKITYMKWQNKEINKDYYSILFKSGRNNEYIEILKWYPTIDEF